jgi:hypothetical protein
VCTPCTAPAARLDVCTAGVGDQAVGLLPQPPDAVPGTRAIASQPQLAHLLRYVLCNAREGCDTATR